MFRQAREFLAPSKGQVDSKATKSKRNKTKQSMSYDKVPAPTLSINETNETRRKSRTEYPSSSSGGSSSGYLSQATNGLLRATSSSLRQQQGDHDDNDNENPAENGVVYTAPKMTQSTPMPTTTTTNQVDQFHQLTGHQFHKYPSEEQQQQMLPIMIDDDDDDDDVDLVLAASQHNLDLDVGYQDADADDDDDDENELDQHHDHPVYHPRERHLMIDGFQRRDLDDNLSQTFNHEHQRRRRRPPRWPTTMSLAQAQALVAFDLQQRQRRQQQRAAINGHEDCANELDEELDDDEQLGHDDQTVHHLSLNLTRPTNNNIHHNFATFDPNQHAAIYYQPNNNNLITSSGDTYRAAKHYSQSTSTFHYPNQITAAAAAAAHAKPVPPLPPPSARLINQNHRFATTNAKLNYARTKKAAGAIMIAGSRQHLSSPGGAGAPQRSASPHSRRVNNNNNNLTMAPSKNHNHHQQQQHHNLMRSVPNNQSQLAAARESTAVMPLAGSGGPVGCCGKMAKFLLFMANFLFWCAGIALGAWGILALVEDHKYNLSQLLVFEPNSRASLFQLLSWSFITLGCATILVGFCGCSAMFKNSRWILGLYIFLILATFALDLATGLLAIIFQERLVANVRLRLVSKLRNEYGIQASFTAAMDYIQTRFECCGLDGHFDYDQSLWRLQRLGGFEATVARTCCHLRNTLDDQAHVNPRPVNETMCQSTDVRFHQSYRYRRGCLDDLERLIRHKIWTFTIGCGAVGAIILLTLLFATCFCRSIPAGNSRKSSAATTTTKMTTATGNRVYQVQQEKSAGKKNRPATNYR